MIVTTGDLRGDYEILDAIFAMDSHAAGFFLGANPAQAFDGVKEKLRQAGREMRADAIICCQFEYRVAIADGLFGTKQCIELFAYGTAVRLRLDATPEAPKVAEEEPQAAPGESAGPQKAGVCYCCGQPFVEAARRLPAIGEAWVGALGEFTEGGTCPRCYMTYGALGGMLRPWTAQEWNALITASSEQQLHEVVHSIEERGGDLLVELTSAVESRLLVLQQEQEEARQRHEAAKREHAARKEADRAAAQEAERAAMEKAERLRLAAMRACTVCGKRYPPRKLNHTGNGEVCDLCLVQ